MQQSGCTHCQQAYTYVSMIVCIKLSTDAYHLWQSVITGLMLMYVGAHGMFLHTLHMCSAHTCLYTYIRTYVHSLI